MNEINFIVALLPLAAIILVIQVNPYNALVIRGVLGAVAALVYAVLGAADVALTDALMGTMLAITLYAIAVRSSLVMRLGVLQERLIQENSDRHWNRLIDDLRTIFSKYYLRLELVSYKDNQALHQALMAKEVHGICLNEETVIEDEKQLYHTYIRVQRLYEIIQTELSSSEIILTHVTTADSKEQNK